jgi:lipopolysaccharide/colanic/teichoic acid biosynthesis glycosyltransferase
MAKRIFDLIAAGAALVILSPFLAAIALWIRIDSPGPIMFRQERVGLHGRLFRIHKFRTMVADAETRGPQLTVDGDARVTRAGRLLRRYKLDELPQLIDVFRGEMSLVGPRPEVPKYVALYPERVRSVILSVRPGITDLASIEFRNENQLLGAAPDPEREYIEKILPVKLSYYQQYAQSHTLWGDVKILVGTLRAVLS